MGRQRLVQHKLRPNDPPSLPDVRPLALQHDLARVQHPAEIGVRGATGQAEATRTEIGRHRRIACDARILTPTVCPASAITTRGDGRQRCKSPFALPSWQPISGSSRGGSGSGNGSGSSTDGHSGHGRSTGAPRHTASRPAERSYTVRRTTCMRCRAPPPLSKGRCPPQGPRRCRPSGPGRAKGPARDRRPGSALPQGSMQETMRISSQRLLG